jgi:hypothetical protein
MIVAVGIIGYTMMDHEVDITAETGGIFSLPGALPS